MCGSGNLTSGQPIRSWRYQSSAPRCKWPLVCSKPEKSFRIKSQRDVPLFSEFLGAATFWQVFLGSEFFVWNCGRIVGPGSHPLYCLVGEAIASHWNNGFDFILLRLIAILAFDVEMRFQMSHMYLNNTVTLSRVFQFSSLEL